VHHRDHANAIKIAKQIPNNDNRSEAYQIIIGDLTVSGNIIKALTIAAMIPNDNNKSMV
jgi:hypothetical protein